MLSVHPALKELHDAIRSDTPDVIRIEACVRACEDNGVSIDTLVQGRSPLRRRSALHVAIAQESLAAVRVLLEAGANPELPDYFAVGKEMALIKNKKTKTPLSDLCCDLGQSEWSLDERKQAINLLVMYGADVNGRGIPYYTKPASVMESLLMAGLDVNQVYLGKSHERTLLSVAVAEGYVEVARMLLWHGAHCHDLHYKPPVPVEDDPDNYSGTSFAEQLAIFKQIKTLLNAADYANQLCAEDEYSLLEIVGMEPPDLDLVFRRVFLNLVKYGFHEEIFAESLQSKMLMQSAELKARILESLPAANCAHAIIHFSAVETPALTEAQQALVVDVLKMYLQAGLIRDCGFERFYDFVASSSGLIKDIVNRAANEVEGFNASGGGLPAVKAHLERWSEMFMGFYLHLIRPEHFPEAPYRALESCEAMHAGSEPMRLKLVKARERYADLLEEHGSFYGIFLAYLGNPGGFKAKEVSAEQGLAIRAMLHTLPQIDRRLLPAGMIENVKKRLASCTLAPVAACSMPFQGVMSSDLSDVNGVVPK